MTSSAKVRLIDMHLFYFQWVVLKDEGFLLCLPAFFLRAMPKENDAEMVRDRDVSVGKGIKPLTSR